MKPFRSQLCQLLWPHRWLLAALLAVALLYVATEGAGLGVVLVLLDAGHGGAAITGHGRLGLLAGRLQDLTAGAHIRIAAAALVAIAVLRSGLQYGQHLLTLRLRRRVERRLQLGVFHRLHELALTTLQGQRRADLQTLLTQYPQQTGDLALLLGRSVASAALLLGYIALALAVSWPLTLVCLLVLMLEVRGLRPWIGARLSQVSQRNQELINEVNHTSGEHLAAMKLIRLFGRGEWSRALYAEKLETANAYEYRMGALAGLFSPLFNLVHAVALSMVLVAGAVFLHGTPAGIVAKLVVFLVIAYRLLGPINEFTEVQNRAAEVRPMMDALFRFLQPVAPTGLAPIPGSRPFAGLRQGVALQNVAFSYPPAGAPVLQDVSLQIARGQTTAIVGGSGSGKSTVISLLTRLYDPTGGSVRVDGVDLRELDLGWRRHLAMTSQDVFLFHASVRENLLFAKPAASDAEMEAACRLAQAHDFVRALPEGYDTILQERGQRLSGGQRQRIALARALLMDADLLILDEATSELDTLTERAIHDALAQNRGGRTTLIVAHRLSTVRKAQRIYVLENGRLAEAGTHESLLAAGGLYARMAT